MANGAQNVAKRLLITAIAAGLLLAFWTLYKGWGKKAISEADLDFPAFEPGNWEFALRTRPEPQPADLTAMQSKLLDAAKRFNVADLYEQPDKKKLRRKLFYRANDVVAEHGFEGFLRAGHHLIGKCERQLQRALRELRQRSESVTEALRKAKKAGGTFSEDFERACGAVLEPAVTYGLITDQANWRSEHGPVVFRVWYKYRWVSIIDKLRSAQALMSGPELKVLYRWRIEQARGFSLDRRKQFLREAERHIEAYPLEFGLAVLDYRAGNRRAALERLRELARKQSKTNRYDRLADWLQNELEREAPSKKSDE